MGFLGDIWHLITYPLYLAISGILILWHHLWGQVFGDASGVSWVLSIIGLTLVIRAALIPLFVKQIKASRASPPTPRSRAASGCSGRWSPTGPG